MNNAYYTCVAITHLGEKRTRRLRHDALLWAHKVLRA